MSGSNEAEGMQGGSQRGGSKAQPGRRAGAGVALLFPTANRLTAGHAGLPSMRPQQKSPWKTPGAPLLDPADSESSHL
jgi:hypothetical protein